MAFVEEQHEQDALLPPGCVFEPSDELLVCHFLVNKITDQPLLLPPDFTIPELDLYGQPPWELYGVASRSRYLPDGTFYCFVRVKRSSAKDHWLKRKTRGGGTWVANGTPCDVLRHGKVAAGTRTALKFFRDGDERTRSKKDRSLGTDWIMHEYRLRPRLYEEISSCDGEEILLRLKCFFFFNFIQQIHRKRSRKVDDDVGHDEQVAPVMTAVGHDALPSPSPPTGYLSNVVAGMMPVAAAGHVALPPTGCIDDVAAAMMPMTACEHIGSPSFTPLSAGFDFEFSAGFDYEFPLMYEWQYGAV